MGAERAPLMRALWTAELAPSSYEGPVLGRQSRRTVRAHCVKLGIPLCGGVAAIEHKEDAGACHLEL